MTQPFDQNEFDGLSVQERCQIMAETVENLMHMRAPGAVFVVCIAERAEGIPGEGNSFAVTHTNMLPSDSVELLQHAVQAMEAKAKEPLLNQ